MENNDFSQESTAEKLEREMEEKRAAEKKQAAVDWRNKQKTSHLFMFFGTIVEILSSIAIMFVLFILTTLLLFRVFNAGENAVGQTIFMILTLVIFLVGIVGGFFIYKSIAKWVIIKFNLQDKLLKDVLQHYIKDDTEDEQKK